MSDIAFPNKNDTAKRYSIESSIIPAKKYFTIGEVSRLCHIKTHVLRYWEKEFTQLDPVRRGKRRYYTQKDISLIQKLRSLLYNERFTIEGARAHFANKNAIQDALYTQLIRQSIFELEKVMDILNK